MRIPHSSARQDRTNGFAIVAESTTDIFLAGDTASSGFPTTPGASDTSHNGASDGWIAKFDRTQAGSAALEWSTFIGGSGSEFIETMAIDSQGRPNVALQVGSAGLATVGAPDSSLSGSADAMLATFSADGSRVEFATYIGGSGVEDSWSIVIDHADRPVMIGDTSSSDFTTTAGAYDTTLGGTDDIFIVRYTALGSPLPVITLVGVNPQAIEVGSPYVELGATAFDDLDGDITGSIVIDASAVNASLVGSYTVTYDVVDSSGNAAVQVVRTVDVVDTTIPVITLAGVNPQTIEVGSPYVELGATALDNYDGDITGSITINSSAVNTSSVGSYTVTYDVIDANGNPAVQITRTVDVVDTTIPVSTLVGVNPQTIEVGSPYVELGATALDSYDGDITGSIVIDTSAVNASLLGSYTVTYDVVDSSGNPAVQITRTVDVVDTTIPVITLVGVNPQTIEVGSAYGELGATASDNYDGDITASIVIDASAVNTSLLGSYTVTYDVTDANGNPAVQVTRTVDVVDTTIPVITLVGANPQTIEVGSPYVELGATALDNYDGDITSSILIDASAVNTAAVGSYTVTYNVTDTAGNAAPQITRTVDVVDTTIPTITLVGADPQTIEVGSPYVELGATAWDSVDGDLTGSIVIDASAVNTSLLGSYTVTYDVVDANGNPAVQVTRTVDVVDTTPPVISLVGANPQTIQVGSPYVELGATALDNYDGDITASIVTDASAVNRSLVGSYTVTYNVTDTAGNAAPQITRTVDVVDTTIPTITLLGANPQTIEVDSPTSSSERPPSITTTETSPPPSSPTHQPSTQQPSGAMPSATTSPTAPATPESRSPALLTWSIPQSQSSPW